MKFVEEFHYSIRTCANLLNSRWIQKTTKCGSSWSGYNFCE